MNEIISEYQDKILIKSNSIKTLTEEKVLLSDKISKLSDNVKFLCTQKSQENLNKDDDLSRELNLLYAENINLKEKLIKLNNNNKIILCEK